MEFFEYYLKQEISTAILVLVVILSRKVVSKLVKRYATASQIIEKRTNLVIKYINILITILASITLILIWGVQTKDIFITLSSIATVIGVAMFAQWSILSNITSGIILFFSFPFKIGDVILIHDKDFPEEGEIEDIGAFHVTLRTNTGELVIYPNNLFFQKGISVIKKPTNNSNEFTD
ncbi:mechanosensitive ion channel family protein [Flavobacterium sp. A45]|jgi:small-conductance mechanosensitive channel|uniref:mechanosensitive ion channel family protein n=1 Tax=Flavobacterium sp. A45 TaxID=1945862 RepID=UPI000987CAC4|nr:mechanosensitive ion channel domain-containing protein [Flavobacterium sp. A45]OOG65881.1 mechanosensitive ion channel protein MscS [Flavobacterium sp. A45]